VYLSRIGVGSGASAAVVPTAAGLGCVAGPAPMRLTAVTQFAARLLL